MLQSWLVASIVKLLFKSKTPFEIEVAATVDCWLLGVVNATAVLKVFPCLVIQVVQISGEKLLSVVKVIAGSNWGSPSGFIGSRWPPGKLARFGG